jgi:SAM-dependent methyltransferase
MADMLALSIPYRFRCIHSRFRSRSIELLDVGCGSHSASAAKRWLPNCRYTGIDRDRHYFNDATDLAAMDAFYEMDLTLLRFAEIPDAHFDVLLMSHVIEHLHNGDEVLRGLLPKVRPGGLVFVEFPGERSLSLPSMPGSLNFHDDPTHVRLFTAREVAALLSEAGCSVIRAGVRHDPAGILLMGPRILKSLFTGRKVPGGVFWDLLGFADCVIAVKPPGAAAVGSVPPRDEAAVLAR